MENLEVIAETASPRGDDATQSPPSHSPVPSGTASASVKPKHRRNFHPLCRACAHPDADAITHELINGAPVAQIARRFSLSNDGVRRHRAHHVSPEAIARAKRRKILGDSQERLEDLKADESTNMLARLAIVRGKINAALAKAEQVGDLRAVALLSAQIHVNATLIAKLLGELQTPGGMTVNVGIHNQSLAVTSPDLFRLRDLIERTLFRWPDARRALLSALAGEKNHVALPPG